MGRKNVPMLSAGIAYFGVLAFFPMVAAIVALAGMSFSSEQIQSAAGSVSQFVPRDIYSLFVTQLHHATEKPATSAIVAVLGIGLSVLSVAGAIANTMSALNVMYELKETRNFFKQRLVSIVLTLGLLLSIVAIVPLLFTSGEMLRLLGAPQVMTEVFLVVRWLLLAVLMMVGLAVLYRFGPSHEPKEPWQWVSWGAIIATLIWIVGSAAFFVYLQKFANFSDSYSLFAGLIAFMIWLNLSSFIVLLGAEINHRIEQRLLRSNR